MYKRQILDSALRIIGTHGIYSLTHRSVAKEAKVAHSTVSYYFRTIDDLTVGAFKKLIADDKVIDTLVIARAKHPGMPNNLDALCKRYNIAEQKRGLHDAKSDCELLAQVYIELIGGRQSNLELHKDETNKSLLDDNVNRVLRERRPAQELTTEELDKHREFTKNFVKKALWSKKD